MMMTCVPQMNISVADMDASLENTSIVHLSAPIIPDRADVSNMTIIRTGNGTILQDQIFLNTMTARALSGIFVWSALLITCHQVSRICLELLLSNIVKFETVIQV